MSRVLSLPGKGAAAPEGPPAVNSVEEILAKLRAGRMVVIVDDEDRENEGDLIMAAEYATPEAVAFMIRHTSGIICVPMEEQQLARLDRSEEHTSELQSPYDLVCRLLLEKKKKNN